MHLHSFFLGIFAAVVIFVVLFMITTVMTPKKENMSLAYLSGNLRKSDGEYDGAMYKLDTYENVIG